MSHIHISEGILAWWLCMLGYLLVGVYFFFFSRYIKKAANHKKLTVVSSIAAFMLLSMSIPIPFVIPYHMNLSALTGILAGPFYAGVAIFCVNLILALLGHGGITVVGLNTVVITIEAVVAWALFRILKTKFNVFKSAFIATFLSLIISAMLTMGIIYTGTKNLGNFIHHHGCCEKHSEHEHEHEHEDEADHVFDPKRFLTLVLIAGAFGWTLESFLTGFIVNYVNRVKPDLFEE